MDSGQYGFWRGQRGEGRWRAQVGCFRRERSQWRRPLGGRGCQCRGGRCCRAEPPNSCVAASGEILSGGAVSEAELIAQLGTPSNAWALAGAISSDSYLGNPGIRHSRASRGRGARAGRRGANGAVLQAPFTQAHMVLIEGLEEAGSFLVRDPAIGGTYQVTEQWIGKFVAIGVTVLK
jgi:hypothetical protein